MPRKDSAASPVMYAGIDNENATRIGAPRLGSSSRKRMRLSRAPLARAASTNSRSQLHYYGPRTSRAVVVQPNAVNSETSTMTRNQPGTASRGP